MRRDEALVELSGVTKVYGEGTGMVTGLADVSLRVGAGEFLGIMGPTGGGKTTLINLIGGLDRPTRGTVRVADHQLERAPEDVIRLLRRRHIGVVFQAFNLLPSLSALENVALPLLADGLARRAAEPRARAALEQVHLVERAAARPAELSGGEQQRVALARALIADPMLLLADEPTGCLDTRTGAEMVDLLLRAHRLRGVTIILVTHDERIATACTRTVTVADGAIVADRRRPVGSTAGG